MLNRVALITGVGPGLGAALARRFAREGFHVGLLARSPDFIHPLAEEISASGPRAISVVADVSRPVEARAAVQRVRENLGSIGVLIHNPSSALGQGLLATTPEQFEQCWRVAALGGFVCAQETASDMLQAGDGVMLFTGATSSVRGGGWLAFSSAKFAVRGTSAIPRTRVVVAGRARCACRYRWTDRHAAGPGESAGRRATSRSRSHRRCLLASGPAGSLGLVTRA